jgi:hypothetical protein
MFEPKPLTREAIPAALEKAVRYRLLNEPSDAESICHDVLRIDPDNEQALITLLLAITDRFSKGYAVGSAKAHEILARLRSEYDRVYYSGLIAERRAKALLAQNMPGTCFDAHELLREAMTYYESAEALRPAQNDDALLRWNACARIIDTNRLEARAIEPPGTTME